MSSGPTGMDGICQWEDWLSGLGPSSAEERLKAVGIRRSIFCVVKWTKDAREQQDSNSHEMGFCPLLLNGYNFTFLKCFCLLLSVTSGLIDYVPAEEDDYDPGEGEGDDQT
ncbi:hypothetical protein NC653_022625 [Populus alba x Populus x berolinensis]|uniref:Uncharacterized protein n=1 Tax=Populus alba x Populus x berolinensis TaxID=444605 RepID=A0AAD6MFB9_9ROSI|nr:hypothetical protein NC653_022625 [Populus alba x Populus x berolinensis]